MEQCKTLRQRGYRFCLNDFKLEEPFSPFLQLAELVQISMAGTDRAKVGEGVTLVKKLSARLLASDVNSEEEFNYGRNLGFDLFKGSFYYKPGETTQKSISPSQILLLELSTYLARDKDMHIVEGIFKKNPELTFGLLKLINSAFFRVQQKVTSIRQAIALLGYGNLQKWVGLLLFTIDHRDHTVNPLVEKVLIRGRMMEMLAERVTRSKTVADSAFITGILSFVNVLFGKPLPEIVDKLNLAPEISDALLQRTGVLGNCWPSPKIWTMKVMTWPNRTSPLSVFGPSISSRSRQRQSWNTRHRLMMICGEFLRERRRRTRALSLNPGEADGSFACTCHARPGEKSASSVPARRRTGVRQHGCFCRPAADFRLAPECVRV